MITQDLRWSLPRGNTPVPSRWQATTIGWGQRGNFISIPTDCPQRDDRRGDARIFADHGHQARWISL